MKRNNEQSKSRKHKRGHLKTLFNPILKRMETYRRSKRGKLIQVA